MKTIKIMHRSTDAIIYSTEVDDSDPAPMRTVVSRALSSGADLGGAYLGGAYLGGAYLGGAYLSDADLRGAYLSGAYLSGANLRGADLGGAYLSDADLRGAYLSGAYLLPAGIPATDPPEPYTRPATRAERMARYRARHPEVPVVANLDSKILHAVTEGGGKLYMGQWHTCETTHCRSGWAITIAGPAGKELERRYGPQRAGAMIYLASTGRVPWFFAPDAVALEDIRRCAAEEQSESRSP